jgi:hypothetical protein
MSVRASPRPLAIFALDVLALCRLMAYGKRISGA